MTFAFIYIHSGFYFIQDIHAHQGLGLGLGAWASGLGCHWGQVRFRVMFRVIDYVWSRVVNRNLISDRN